VIVMQATWALFPVAFFVHILVNPPIFTAFLHPPALLFLSFLRPKKYASPVD
jgi:hypothetical protein